MKDLKILVRLPNWLGDMVMAAGFMQALQQLYPSAAISVISKKGLQQLLPYFPATQHQFIFDKTAYKGLEGAWHFGKEIREKETFDLFFCLPDSFSSTVMGWASGAKKRIGFRNTLRTLLFTDTYKKPAQQHRADTYLALLEHFSKTHIPQTSIRLLHPFQKEGHVVVNINSEASSRRLTEQKAAELLGILEAAISQKIILIGAPKEAEFVHGVLKKLPNSHIENKAGKTDLPQLVQLLASASVLLTTDSGPAHLANALGTYTIVLFGAGNELETAPYNKELRTIIRLGQLSCEPCEKNVCVRYGIPQCLERLNAVAIVEAVALRLNTSK